MQTPIPKPQEIAAFKKKLLDQIKKQREPTAKDRFNQTMFNRTTNPETMPAERLREFQSNGWFMGYEPREMTLEQVDIEEEELQVNVKEAFPDTKSQA